jgi:hypothetical protein
MRKFVHLDTLDQPKKPRSKALLVVFFALVAVAAPPLYELARLKLAEHGILDPVATPLLDTISAQWAYSDGEFRDWLTPLLARRRWSPSMVLPIAFLWCALGAFMLRRSH